MRRSGFSSREVLPSVIAYLPLECDKVCGGIGINYQTHTHTHTQLCAHNTLLLPYVLYILCNRPRDRRWSVLRLGLYTLQFSFALAAAVSVFVSLWCLDVKISWLGGWASQWRPLQVHQ